MKSRRKRNINVWLPLVHPLLKTWPTTQAGVPDWEPHWRPFGAQSRTQSTKPHQPGLLELSFKVSYKNPFASTIYYY